jgi:hypothetical protein
MERARIPGGDVTAAVVIAALAFAVHRGALGNAFYNDDAIFLNQARRILADPAALLAERPLGYFRPVWSAWITAIYALAGLAPVAFFAAGIALHAATGVLVHALARRIGLGPLPALAGGAFFVAAYPHSEGVQWIAAHNSILVCFFSLLALLAHLRAIEYGGVRRALLTALALAAALYSKEPGIVAIAWLPLAEATCFSLRSCFRRASLLRYGLVLAVAAIYLASNERLRKDMLEAEKRATASYATPARVIGAAGWMYSPVRHSDGDTSVPLGLLALLFPLGACVAFDRKRVPAALLAAAMLVTAMAPACSTRTLQDNGSRLFYFPTAGAALGLAIAASALTSRSKPRNEVIAIALPLLVLVAFHARTVDATNAADYRLISALQTRLAESLPAWLDSPHPRPIVLLEPWIDNLMHAQQFFELYAAIDAKRIRRASIARAGAEAFIARQRDRLGARVLDCDDTGALVPATRPPSNRNVSQNNPRTRDTGVYLPTISILWIDPPEVR